NDPNLCLVPGTGTSAGNEVATPAQSTPPAAVGWCAPVTGSTGSNSYSYQVCPRWQEPPTSTQPTCLTSGAPTGFIAIAATGTTSAGSAGQVTRRVELVAKTSSGAQQF